MSDLQRPECFEFAMDFLGDPEESVIRAYIENLESKLSLLTELGQRLVSQNNRITADPVFAVMQKREVVVPEEMYHDRVQWIDEDGYRANDSDSEKLDELRDDPGSDRYTDDEINLDGIEWRRVALQDVDEFVTSCFTEQGCKDFLEANGHNLRRPFIYVFSAYRNEEWIKLRALMLDLAKGAQAE